MNMNTKKHDDYRIADLIFFLPLLLTIFLPLLLTIFCRVKG